MVVAGQMKFAILAGDSILRHIEAFRNVLVLCMPGAGLQDLFLVLLEQRYFSLAYVTDIIVHTGTNRIFNYDPETFCHLFKMFRQDLLLDFDHVNLYFSTIIPRPRDHDLSQPRVDAINSLMKQEGFPLVPTHSRFLKKKRPVLDLYGDKLHPKEPRRDKSKGFPSGAELLQQFYSSHISPRSLARIRQAADDVLEEWQSKKRAERAAADSSEEPLIVGAASSQSVSCVF